MKTCLPRTVSTGSTMVSPEGNFLMVRSPSFTWSFLAIDEARLGLAESENRMAFSSMGCFFLR